MKLLLVTPEFDPTGGGIGRYLSDLYAQLPSDKTRVIYDPDVWKPHWILAIPGLAISVLKERASILHISHVLPLGTIALILKFILGLRYVVSLHGMDFALAREVPRRRRLLGLILQNALLVTVTSRSFAQEVFAETGVEPMILRPSTPEQPRKVPFKPKPWSNRLLTVARLVPRKGIDTVIRALVELPEYSFDLVGDGPERASLQSLAKELGVSERVRFHGSVTETEKARLYQGADIFALPTRIIGSDREGFGIVYLEAQSYGLPVIAGAGLGVSEAVHESLERYCVAHTPTLFAAAVREIQSLPPKSELLIQFTDRFSPAKNAKRFWRALKT